MNLELKCPQCESVLRRHVCTTEPGADIEEGDVTICFPCGAVCEFRSGAMVVLSEDELVMLPGETMEAVADALDRRLQMLGGRN